MMSTQITTQGARLVRRHPHRAVGMGLITARRAASDHKVRAETRRARADALHAARRVQRIGMASALTDKRVARKLRHATHHASRAASLSISSPRRHRVRNTSIVVVAAGTLAGAAYAVRAKTMMASTGTADAPMGSDQNATDAEAAVAATPTETQQASAD
jgi:hypothetical protein